MTSTLRLLGVGLVCAKVAIVPVLLDRGADVPFVVVKGFASHALGFALAGVILGLVVRFGRSFFVWSWLHVPVLGFLAANVIATLFAADSLLALYGARGRMLGLGTVADFVVLYFAIALLIRTKREAVALATSALAGSAVVLAYELAQFVSKDPFDWNVDSSVRPFSTLGHPTTLAEYLVVIATGAAALGIFSNQLRPPIRATLLIYSGVLLAGTVVTQTRSAFVGIGAAAVLLLLLTWTAHPAPHARVVSVVGAGVSAVALALLLLFTPLGGRILNTVAPPAVDLSADPGSPHLEESAETRVGLYLAAAAMVRDRPLLGYGPDNFSAAFPAYRTESEPSEIQRSLPTSAHSWLAHIATTTGLLGLGAFLAIAISALALIVRQGFRAPAWAAAAMLVAFLGAGLTTISDLGADWLFWACAGVVGASTGRPIPTSLTGGLANQRRPKIAAAGRRSNGRAIVALGCVAVGLLMALTGVGALSASRSNQDSQGNRLAGRTREAGVCLARDRI
jgi:O-antigen ligase